MTDTEFKNDLQEALDGEPGLNVSDIGLSFAQGVVTLRGRVGSYAEKLAAERAVVRVEGVKAVANDLIVRPPITFERTDTELAQAAVTALGWSTMVPSDLIIVTVANGWLTLNGTVDCQYQKDAASAAVRDLKGAKGVNNYILVQTHVEAADVQKKIEAAFKRSAELDARGITVVAQEGKVILTGNVHSWSERQEAERAAWAATGVTEVDDRLAVVP